MADSILRWFNEDTIIEQLSMLAQRWKDHVGRWIQAVITKADAKINKLFGKGLHLVDTQPGFCVGL